MKRRLLSMLLGVSLLTTGLVGCGSSEPAETTDTGSTGSETTAESTVWEPGSLAILVPGKAGGGSDLTTRALATNWQTITPGLKIAVENFDNTAVCYQTIKGEKPDGETLSLAHSGLITQYLTGSLDVNPEEDLTLIAALGNNGLRALAVPADAPYDTLDEFIAYAQANPGAIKAGMAPNGTNHFLLGKMEEALDIEFTYVEAANEADRLTGLAGGFLDFGAIGLSSAIEYEEAGKIKVIATVGTEGSNSEDFYPGRPDNYKTIEEQGYDCAIGTNYYLFGPAGMDSQMVEEMNASLQPLGDEGSSYCEEMEKLGQIGEWHNVEESQQILAAEMDDMTQIAKDIGVYGLE